MIVGQFIDTYHPVIDGVVQTVANYQRILKERGNRCWVIAPDVPGYVDEPGQDILRYRSYSIPQRPPYRIGIPQIDIRFRRSVSQAPFEIVHVHSPFTCGDMGLSLARRRQIPIVGTFHSKYYDDFLRATHSEVISKTAVQAIARFYRRLDEVWSVSEATAETLREYGYRGPITVMPNGTEYAMPQNPETLRRLARETFQLPEDRPILLFVGQHIWQKNLRLILNGVQALKRKGERFLLLMAGDGVDRAAIDRHIREARLEDVARRLGSVRDRDLLAGLYLSSSIFTFPSLYDNAPLVVREASSLELPSLLVRGATCAQGVTHEENGFLCENDPEDFAKTITEALRDEPRRIRIGKAAAETLAIPWSRILDRVGERYAYLIEAYAVGRKR